MCRALARRIRGAHVRLLLLLLLLTAIAANSASFHHDDHLSADRDARGDESATDGHDARTRVSRVLKSAAETIVPFSSVDTISDTLANGAAFIVVLVAAHPLGLLFPKLFRLPLITGYLFIGIFTGPFIANVLSKDLVGMLAPTVNALALSFISFQAGQEIYLPELRPQIKDIFKLLAIIYCVTMVLVTTVITLFNNPFFYDKFDMSCQLPIGLMFGSIAVLVSPSTVMAIKIELNSVGPFTNLMLGTTMTAEFIVLISFSVARIFSTIHCAKLDVSVANLFFTFAIVLSNLVLGAILSVVIIAIFSIPGGPDDQLDHMDMEVPAPAPMTTRSKMAQAVGEVDLEAHSADPDNAPHPHNAYVEADDEYVAAYKRSAVFSVVGSLYFKGFIWLFMGFLFYIGTSTISEAAIAAYGHSWDVKFEPLLVLMVASCLAGHYATIRHDMHVILDSAAPYMFLPFFVMTGAALKLDQVADAIPLMSLYLALRYLSMFLACYCGGRFILKLPPQQYNNLWLTLTPQVGVALGLANEVKELSSDPWASEFAATIVAAVVVNQIIGPVLCSFGLKRAGESQYERLAASRKEQEAAPPALERTSSYTSMAGPSGKGGRMPRLTSDTTTTNAGDSGDPRALLPFYRVRNAVVIGEDEVAFEVALELSLYGAHVNVPLLDEELAGKWQQMNEAILARTANGDLITYKNKLKDRKEPSQGEHEQLHGLAASTDVLIFTGDPSRTLEHVKAMVNLLGADRPRMIAVIPDCTFCEELKELGVLTVQPSIALANIATRLALLDQDLAEALSAEISTTSNFSTAAYFMQHDADRASVHSLSEMRLQGRRLALGRSVVNHHSVDYDRLAEMLAAENLPLPPPPSRVSMFGTSAVNHDPFAARGGNMSAYEHFVVEDDSLAGGGAGGVFDEQFLRGASPRSSFGGSQRAKRFSRKGSSMRMVRQRSRVDSGSSSGGYFRLRRGSSVVSRN